MHVNYFLIYWTNYYHKYIYILPVKCRLWNTFLTQSIQRLVLHEVGHTLGLNHNMKGSSIQSVADLKNQAKMDKEGMCNSVMEYPAINFALNKNEQTYYYDDKIHSTCQTETFSQSAHAERSLLSRFPHATTKSENNPSGSNPCLLGVIDLWRITIWAARPAVTSSSRLPTPSRRPTSMRKWLGNSWLTRCESVLYCGMRQIIITICSLITRTWRYLIRILEDYIDDEQQDANRERLLKEEKSEWIYQQHQRHQFHQPLPPAADSHLQACYAGSWSR